MNADRLIDMMEGLGELVSAAVKGIHDEDLHWKPSPNEWSMLEILCHLGDEEGEDFRARLKLTLEDPGDAWNGIDPERWAKDRKYNERDPGEVIQRIREERKASIAWLRGLEAPNWAHAHHHAVLGTLKAGDLLAAWAAHDALHLRQLAKRRIQIIQNHAPEYSPTYAGSW